MIVLPKDDRTDSFRSSILDHDFGHFDLSVFHLTMIWAFWLWNFSKRWGIFHFDLSICGYCISCLTWTSRKSGYNVHDFRGCHLGHERSLFSENCVRTTIIFYHVTSEYDSTFVFLLLRFQLRILEMTEIHQWRKMNFSALFPCFIDHFFLVSYFRQVPCLDFLQFFPFFLHCLPLHLEFFMLWGIEMNLRTRL